MSDADDELLEMYGERRTRRIRITAWAVIVALILGAGGTTIFSILFG